MTRLQPVSRASTPDGATSRATRRGIGRRGVGRGTARRLLVTAVLACVALLAVAPGAFAASGSISGIVTEVTSKTPLIGIEATVYPEGGKPVTVKTGVTGSYSVGGLTAGSYIVAFADPAEKYAPQYYKGVKAFIHATPVTVVEGSSTSEINAELREGGTISGTLFGPANERLPNAEVDVAGTVEGEPYFAEAVTGPTGEYKLSGLPASSYTVGFAPPFGSDLGPAYYKEAYFRAGAIPLEVVEATTYVGINATLKVGGRISGRVTDAATHAPLANIFVSAEGGLTNPLFPFEVFGGLTETNSNGEYSIAGLGTEAYNLEFAGGVQYITKLFRGVSAIEGTTTSLNVNLNRREPVNTVPPALFGAIAVGQPVFCTQGTWTGVAPMTFTYAWLRDGTLISGATGNMYTVQSADEGQELACRVTAKNSSGSASATSNVLKVPPAQTAPPPTPLPTIESVSQSNSRWREGNKLATYSRSRPPVGTTFRFVVNQQAVVSLAFKQQVGGRKVRGSCVAQTRGNRHQRSCKRTVTQGTMSFTAHSGSNRMAFQGRMSRSKKLPLGAYTLRITAVSSSGQRSNTRTLNFTIVK